MQIYNCSALKKIRRRLRKNMPQPEIILWSRLKAKQVLGYKFRRQASIGHYIIDFYCPRARFAIEIDGDSHYQDENSKEKDLIRQKRIESFGIKFLRFTNREIADNLDGVIEKIIEELKTTTPSPSLIKEGK